jgi:integrase
MSAQAFCYLLSRYLRLLPNALRSTTLADGSQRVTCIFSPESLRITAANKLLTRGLPLGEIQELLGHRHLRTTRSYLRPEKRCGSADNASASRAPIGESIASPPIFEEKTHNVAG